MRRRKAKNLSSNGLVLTDGITVLARKWGRGTREGGEAGGGENRGRKIRKRKRRRKI